MKLKLVERTQVLTLVCGRERKFNPGNKVLSDEKRKFLERKMKCKFGFTQLCNECAECRWLEISEAVSKATGEKIVTEREIPFQKGTENGGNLCLPIQI